MAYENEIHLRSGASSITLTTDGTQLLVGGLPITSALAARQQAQMVAQGYFAENYQREAVSSNALMVSGIVNYMAIGLLAGDVVTNIVAMCSGGGSGFSGIGMKVGIYSKAGVRLAQSGDVSAVFSATGARTAPLSAPYTVPATDGYYIAMLAISSAPPTLLRASQNLTGLGPFTGGTLNALGNQNGQTDLPAPATIAIDATVALWVGVS